VEDADAFDGLGGLPFVGGVEIDVADGVAVGFVGDAKKLGLIFRVFDLFRVELGGAEIFVGLGRRCRRAFSGSWL